MSDTAEASAKHVKKKKNKSNKNKISEIKKLSIDSTLWAKPTEIILLDDIDLNKLSIKGKYISKYDLIDYKISTITIVIKSIVKKDISKYYPQISLNNCTYKI